MHVIAPSQVLPDTMHVVPPSQVLPDQENLSSLLGKIVSVFEVESVQDGRDLPTHPLQREAKDLARARSPFWPMSGNDFHVSPRFSCSPSWEATLRLETNSSSTELPLCHVTQHPGSADEAVQTVEQAVPMLRASWPDATVGLLRRRQLGPGFHDLESPTVQLFAWLASKKLNPTYEGFYVDDLFLSQGRLRTPLRPRTRGVQIRELPRADWKPLSASKSPSDQSPDAQIWSFTGPDPWVVSLPVLCAVLLLMVNPTKKVDKDSDCPDRELSWCLDSMHAFCRLKGPEEGSRCISWSLGTSPDCWTYLHFVFYSFGHDDDSASQGDSDLWTGSGVKCERRSISLPIGRNGETVTFGEDRTWLGMRTGTSYGNWIEAKHPGTVAFSMCDERHFVPRASHSEWNECGLKHPDGASGIALFQMLLMSGTDLWSSTWQNCLDYIDSLYEVTIGDLVSGGERLETLMADPSGQLAERYFKTANLLKIFQKHVDAIPHSLRAMEKTWRRTYPGLHADLLTRFSETTQVELLDNWRLVIAHAENKHGKLSARIEKMVADLMRLRDSLFLSRLSRDTG